VKLISKFRRNESPLHLPTAMAEGVTHGPGGTWGWVEIPARATDELNTQTIFRATSEGANDLRQLIPAGAEFHAKVQWSHWTADDYRAEETAPSDDRPPLTAGGLAYVDLGADRIEELAFPKRVVLLGVRFDEAGTTAPVALLARKLTGGAMSTAQQDAAAAFGRTLAKVRGWQTRMAASSFKARPATVQQLAWSLRRDLRRTVSWLPSGSVASGGQVMRLTDAQVIPAVHHVQVVTDDGPRYLRMVTTSETGFPTTELELPGGEWLKSLNIVRLDDADEDASPVEVSIRGRNVPQREAAKQLREALALAKSQDREARVGTAEEAPDSVSESASVLKERIREVSQGLVGMIEDAVTWVVEAADVETLDARTQALIDHYAGIGITCWAPPSIQDLLYRELVIGDTRRVQEFTQFRPTATLVGAWFHGGSEVGSRTGLYLGGNIGSTPGPFRNRLSDAQLEGKSITTPFLGKSGSGKSTAVMLSVIAEAMLGGWTMLVDLKGDLGGCATVCEMFDVPVTRVSTDQISSGALDPFRYVEDPHGAASEVVDNLSMMLGVSEGDDAEHHIRRAANTVADGLVRRRMSTNAVIVALAESSDPAAVKVGEDLMQLARDPLARPVAGFPDVAAKSLPTTPGLVYFKFPNLRYPGKDTAPSKWKPGQRVSMMLVQAAFNYALYMATTVKGIPKCLALTELHLISGYDFGRGLISEVARTGRARDVNLLLDTQACAELLGISGLVDQISQVHAFLVETDDEADAQAVMLGLAPEQAIRNRQQSWGQGQCLTRDREGRVGPVQFDYLHPHIKDALQTKPERHAQLHAVAFDLDEDAEATA